MSIDSQNGKPSKISGALKLHKKIICYDWIIMKAGMYNVISTSYNYGNNIGIRDSHVQMTITLGKEVPKFR